MNFVCIRCGESRPEKFGWGHRPKNSDIRTCGGTVVPEDQVLAAAEAEEKKYRETVARIARAESGMRPG